VDYDDDGILDFISGSYDPGDTYLFRGLGDGRYAAVEKILDKNDVPVVHHPEQLVAYERMRNDPDADRDKRVQARVASFGSWVAPVDWDDDGDLDLLIGSFGGQLYLRINEGTRSQPIYSPESIPVQAAGEPLRVRCHANPVVADWNEDGLWDLVVSAGDGSVGCYENTGTAASPRFSERRLLVEAPAESKFWMQYLDPGQDPQPGVRAQICVVDYNLDGRLDLVLGDFSGIARLRELDEAQRAEFEAVLQSIEQTSAALRAEGRGIREADDREQRTKELQAEIDVLLQKKAAFLLKADDHDGGTFGHPVSSFVWLYLRQPGAAANAAGPGRRR